MTNSLTRLLFSVGVKKKCKGGFSPKICVKKTKKLPWLLTKQTKPKESKLPSHRKEKSPHWVTRCGPIPGQYVAWVDFSHHYPHLQIPRVGPDCRRPQTRLQAPRGMTALGLPPSPEGAVGSRSPPRTPWPAIYPRPRRPSSFSHLHLLTSRHQLTRVPSLGQLLPSSLPPFRFHFYFPRREENGGQSRRCQWAAAPLCLPPHPTWSSPGSLAVTEYSAPTTTQTYKPGWEGGGGASAGLHVTRPQRRQRRHVGSPGPHPVRARRRPPPARLLLASRPRSWAAKGAGLAPRARPQTGTGADARVPGAPRSGGCPCGVRPAASSSLPEDFPRNFWSWLHLFS